MLINRNRLELTYVARPPHTLRRAEVLALHPLWICHKEREGGARHFCLAPKAFYSPTPSPPLRGSVLDEHEDSRSNLQNKSELERLTCKTCERICSVFDKTNTKNIANKGFIRLVRSESMPYPRVFYAHQRKPRGGEHPCGTGEALKLKAERERRTDVSSRRS